MRLFRNALLLATALIAAPIAFIPISPAAAQIAIGVNVTIEPPALPVYEQPPLPAPGYLWTPGFWAYGAEGYYWVPGTWVQPPQPGLLWTPGYWGFNNGVYAFNAGYWAPHVGFYGGINYGFGYNGLGFFGGEWRGGLFAYNRAAVSSFGGVHITNVYNRTIVVNHVTNISFNGGPHGIDARPTAEQMQFAHDQHIERTAIQNEHIREASQNRELLASANHGHPPIAATQRPNEFKGPGVVAARDAPAHPAAAMARLGTHPVPAPRSRAMARPEAARPEAARPEAAHPEAAHPEAARPDAARPEAEHPEAARPEVEHKAPVATRSAPEVEHRPEAETAGRVEPARPAADAPRRAAPVPHVAAPHPEAAHPAAPTKEDEKPRR